MKKFTLLTFLWVLSVLAYEAVAQTSPTRRCTTMEILEQQMRDPAFKAQFEANQARILSSRVNNTSRTTNSAITNDTIPVVVHIIMANPNTVTDAVCQSQMDVLTEDFKGLNADSTRIPAAFKPLFGKGGLTFMLAKRDPNGLPTNGIQRRTNSITFTAGTANNAKKFATGGLDAWDVNRYFNMWVVQFTDGTLGISVFPGTPGDPSLHGYCCDYRAWGRNASYLYPEFNRGRTATHEIGHFWNLRHIWGDDGGACTGTDFPGSPAGWDDTPNQAAQTFGNPDVPGNGTVRTDACSPTAPGIMYQNYMDYCDDVALVMFSKGQWLRMDQALLTAPDRSPILNSDAYLPPSNNPYDAAISAIVNPGQNQGFCGINSVTPQATLLNMGTVTLTSATITVSVDGGTPTNFAWTGSLALGASTNVTLNTITGLAAGNHTITICVTNINGGQTDAVASNNCRTNNFSIISGGAGGVPLPFFEGFEGTTFPPAGWSITPNTGSNIWARTTQAAKTGTASAYLNWYNNGTIGRNDILRTPSLAISNTFSKAFLRFDYAYRRYNTTHVVDSLDVMISTDCGATFQSIWKRGGADLATAAGATGLTNWFATASDWTQTPIEVNLTPYIGSSIILQFRGRNGYGQNIFLDNINVFGTIPTNYDAQITAISAPAGEFCGSTATPVVTVKNNGLLPLTSVTINTRVDNGTLASQNFTGLNIAPDASQNFTLNQLTNLTNGQHTFTAYTTMPSGQVDQAPGNDTLRRTFVSNVAVTLPIVEGFESATFPPPGWAVINPDAGSITWARTTLGARSGTASARVNHYAYTNIGHLDYLRAPMINIPTTVDSAFVSFYYAYKLYAAADADTLEVVMSKDCGVTWTSLWKRGGNQLVTTAGTGGASWAPTAADWRQERLDISNQIGGGNMFIAFRTKNDYGQNVYIDDINIFSKVLPDYDAQLASLNAPGADVCDATFTPRVTVVNAGKQAITSLKVSYSVDNGAPTTTTFNNINIARGGVSIFTLPVSSALTVGNHTVKVWTSEPSGQADQNVSNDTITRAVRVLASVNAPLVEGFEANTFPPAGWEITQQPVDAITWTRTTNAGRRSLASAYMNNYNYPNLNRRDNLITPVVRYSGADSVFLSFDVAASTYSYPGSTAIPLDTLEVLATTDCGLTYTSIYKKWGNELQTIGEPNMNNDVEFFPSFDRLWRKDSINVSSLLGSTGTVRFMFRNTNNYENNIFVDNVNVRAKVLAAKLKNEGYMITPSPFRTSFAIQHYRAPQDLRGFGVFNSVGQQVVSRSFNNGNADSYIEVNMAHLPAGVYTIKLIYSNRAVSQKIVKVN